MHASCVGSCAVNGLSPPWWGWRLCGFASDGCILIFAAPQIKGNQEEIRTAFIEMDTDGSGYLDGDELEAALGKAGLKFQRHQIISLRRTLDVDGSGSVSIEEFLEFLGIHTDA